MKSTATALFILLLSATSDMAFAAEPKAQSQDIRTEQSVESNRVAPVTAPEPSIQEATPPKTRKLKRCRSYFKTVGIACRKPASR